MSTSQLRSFITVKRTFWTSKVQLSLTNKPVNMTSPNTLNLWLDAEEGTGRHYAFTFSCNFWIRNLSTNFWLIALNIASMSNSIVDVLLVMSFILKIVFTKHGMLISFALILTVFFKITFLNWWMVYEWFGFKSGVSVHICVMVSCTQLI